MPIRNVKSKGPAPPPTAKQRTGDYSNIFSPPQPYQPIQPQAPLPTASWAGIGIPSISTRDLRYFFDTAASLYREDTAQNAPPSHPASPATDAPPGYGYDFQGASSLDPSAILVIWLFRQTRIDIQPVAERFHLGPADRQPLYSLTAQPSVRSATEFNELAIKRRDPINGVWYSTCTSDIEPALDLVKPGNWTVAKLVMESMPVWKKVVAGSVVMEASGSVSGRGNTLRLSWGDRKTLGYLGDAYGLWWESGSEGGLAEAFYLVESWSGFDTIPQGLIRVKPAARAAGGQYLDPRLIQGDLAVIYFNPDGKTPPRFVCCGSAAQVRLDIIMAGLMTVLVIETRKVSVIKELGSLPSYDSIYR